MCPQLADLFTINDTCRDPEFSGQYNPCVHHSCQAGECAVGTAVANGTPCDDDYNFSARKPRGMCTSSSLLSNPPMGCGSPTTPCPNYDNCSPATVPFDQVVQSSWNVPAPALAQYRTPDCPPNHACLDNGAGGGQCVCNDGCGS